MKMINKETLEKVGAIILENSKPMVTGAGKVSRMIKVSKVLQILSDQEEKLEVKPENKGK